MATTPEPVVTTLASSGGWYLCAEGGGGREAVCNRAEAGPWEHWTVHTYDDGRVSLQASNGQYLCAEPDGTVVVNRESSGEYERFTIEVRDVGVCFRTFHGGYLQAPEGGGTDAWVRSVPADPTRPGEWEFFASSVAFWDVTPPLARPLVGPLRVENKLFRDDTGLRRVLFCSWFPALRILRDNPTEFYRQIDAIADAGYQGIRVFWTVGGWDDYWNQREVAPKTFVKWLWTGSHLRTDEYSYTVDAWAEYDELLRTLLRACVERQLRLHLTTGDVQAICPDGNEEIDLHRRVARICLEEGGTDVVAVAEVTNEFPLNRYGGDSDESIAQMGRCLEVWDEAIPGVCTMMGAIPQNEEPESLARASTHGNVCAVHVTRSPEEFCLKRTLGLVYWEGDYRAFPKPFWQGEPAGPGEDSYDRQDDPAFLTALYAMHAVTGQASVWFQGAAVRSFEPLESEWGFLEMPGILSIIPEDIASWDHGSNGHGGIEYWWRGNDFFTVILAGWDPSPPRPIAEWTLYTGTSVHHGVGNPHQGDKHYKGAAKATGLAVGKFA